MLSNTAETKPRPSAVCHEAAGSFSTGMSEAQRMSDSRKMLPLNAPGSSDHCGARHGALTRIASHTAGAAGVRGGDDGRKVADMHLAAEHRARDRAADQRRGDVVEE